jgi:hypothetical protein
MASFLNSSSAMSVIQPLEASIPFILVIFYQIQVTYRKNKMNLSKNRKKIEGNNEKKLAVNIVGLAKKNLAFTMEMLPRCSFFA